MKRFLLLALCALLSANADARTLYVDASRPNNNGNGLSAAKAKKTLQAAVNVAKAGDTILVAQGTYAAPLKTNNKKLKIKAKAGASKTSIRSKKWLDNYSLNLGNGTATSVAGFSVSSDSSAGGVRGGSLSNCTLVELGNTFDVKWTVSKSKLTHCVLDHCSPDTYGNFITGATLNRCKMDGSGWKKGKVASSKLSNTLVTRTENVSLVSCVLANCTVADNAKLTMSKSKAWNTVFHKVASSQFKAKKKNALKNCYKGNTPKFAGETRLEVTEVDDYDVAEWDDDLGDYRYYRTVVDYRLAKGSPCIDKGTKAAAAKKLYGKKDLDGKKRVKGKSVDIGCYEY